MKHRIHINRHIIAANKKGEERKPPITVANYKGTERSNLVSILDKDGSEVAKVIYSPFNPLPCGATVWIETEHNVKTWNV